MSDGSDIKISQSGSFERAPSMIRDWVSADGSTGFPAAPGRYHLYVSLACPWAHRAVIVRMLKGLQDAIGMTVVDPYRDEDGWAFRAQRGGEADPVNGFELLSQAYDATDSAYAGRFSVPVLWDREQGRVVNNESADVIVMLNEAWDEWARDDDLDLYPAQLRAEIDELNGRVYETLNNGVYATGFATTQAAHERAVEPLFETLDALEERLAERRFLFGERVTLADWRLFTTLLRFDPVYHGHFKCNVRRIVDYPALWGYLRDLLSVPGVRETVDLEQIKLHYTATHPSINPTRIVPVGPELDYDEPHGREALA